MRGHRPPLPHHLRCALRASGPPPSQWLGGCGSGPGATRAPPVPAAPAGGSGGSGRLRLWGLRPPPFGLPRGGCCGVSRRRSPIVRLPSRLPLGSPWAAAKGFGLDLAGAFLPGGLDSPGPLWYYVRGRLRRSLRGARVFPVRGTVRNPHPFSGGGFCMLWAPSALPKVIPSAAAPAARLDLILGLSSGERNKTSVILLRSLRLRYGNSKKQCLRHISPPTIKKRSAERSAF